MAKCEGCSEELKRRGKRGPRPQFCSDRCRIRVNYCSDPPAEARVCRECGDSFNSRRRDQLFCTRACSVRWWTRMKLARRQHRNLAKHYPCDPAVFRASTAALELVRAKWPEYLRDDN